jgi:hypothetical protein
MTWESNQGPKTGQPPFVKLADVTLTDDEMTEVQDHWRAHFPSNTEGQWYMKEEFVEPFQRSVIAMCLMGRAERFAILAHSQPEYRGKACEAAAKACSVYPLSAYLYDFAVILDQFGRLDEARTLLVAFLERPEAGPVRELDEVTLRQRDIAGMVARAELLIARRI